MLRLADVSLTYEGPRVAIQALRGINLEVHPGDRLGLCGPSGAGKSSLLLVAAGLYKPSAGRVIRKPALRVGLALQEPELALFARTVGEELAFAPRQQGFSSDRVQAVVQETAARFGLSREVLPLDPFQLTPNQRRLAAMAAVAAGRPDILLVDEPTVGLSATARERFIAFVRDFPGAVMIASHDLDLLWRTCRRLAVLNDGRLLGIENWSYLVSHWHSAVEAGLALPFPLQILAGLAGRGWSLDNPGSNEDDVASAIMAGGPPNGIQGRGAR